ncbi:hypothetical protein AB07_3783 [Citrobacter freundii]|nr:hypothetical protein AB07_3783 [Citrobacter freundii]
MGEPSSLLRALCFARLVKEVEFANSAMGKLKVETEFNLEGFL